MSLKKTLVGFFTTEIRMMKYFKLLATTVVVRELSATTVLTKNGPVTGKRVEADLSLNAAIVQPVDQYLGIPFAQAPVGDLRFRPPQPIVKNWEEPLLVVKTPPSCVVSGGGQEDCLYLNVYVPSAISSSPRAVMVWIYGGGFKSGSISGFDGSVLSADEDVIVVMGNYRLGPLGFLANDETFAESGTSGNWGLLDQRAVLEWVQANIAAFGGDVNRVTIFGESAGAMSVLAHLSSEETSMLFSNAIVQSGTSKVEMFFQPFEDAKKYNQWLMKTQLHCSDMDCLRRIPATRFMISDSERDGWSAPTWANPIFPIFQSGPVIDGVVLKGTPRSILQAPSAKPKSIIIGTTQDEGTVFAVSLHQCVRPEPHFPTWESELNDTVFYMTQNQTVTDQLMTEYPKYVEAFPSENTFGKAQFEFVSGLIRDVMFACPTVDLAESLTLAGHSVFVYNFAYEFWPLSSQNVALGSLAPYLGEMTIRDFGAFHSSDVPFVFKQFLTRNITLNDVTTNTPYVLYMGPLYTKPGDVQHSVADSMACYWSNLAKCGSPACSDCATVEWTQYDPSNPAYLLFEADGSIRMDANQLDGEMRIGESFPPVAKCKWYMDNINTPFHDLRGDLHLGQAYVESDLTTKSSSVAVSVVVFLLVLISTIM